MNWSTVLETIIGWVLGTGIRIIVSLLILWVSFRLISVVFRKIEKKHDNKKSKVDKTFWKASLYVTKVALRALVIVCIIGYLGIDTSSITALITSLGVCVGLAINGALENFAGGVLLLVTRPFKIDDFIEVGGYSGTVEDIHIVNTKIRTPDNKVVYIPNGMAASSSVVNYSEKDSRRVDLTFSIAYSADFEKARGLIAGIVDEYDKIKKDPAPMIRMSAHSSSSIDIACKVWVATPDYWEVNFTLLERVKKSFDENDIEIPFNQLDVHMK